MTHRFSPIEQRTLRFNVVESIRAAILDGSLAAGSQLVEARIAEEMGISRAPVREALRQLEEEGLVVSIPYKGTFVNRLGPDQIAEIASLRMVLEPFAIQRALSRLRDGGVERLELAVQRLIERAQQGDAAGCVEAHLAVHRVFYELAEHKLLLEIWRGLEGQLRLYLAMDHLLFGSLEEIARAHLELLDVVRRGDADEIMRTLVAHVQGPAEALVGRLGRPDDGKTPPQAVGDASA